MKKMHLVATAVAMIALATATAWADPPDEDRPGPPPQRGPMHMFERLGGDDGAIVLDELPEQMPEQFKQRLAEADKDGDGKVTRDEFEAGLDAARKRFAERRKDGKPRGEGRPDRPSGDGPKPRDRDEDMDGPPRRPGPGFDRPPMPDLKKVFARMDRDDDGNLSLEEFTEGMRRMHRHMMGHHGPMGMHHGPHGRPPMGPPMWGYPGAFAHRGPWGMPYGPGKGFSHGKPWDRSNAWAHGPRGPKKDRPEAGPDRGPRGPKKDRPEAGPDRGPRGPKGPQGEPPEQKPSEEA